MVRDKWVVRKDRQGEFWFLFAPNRLRPIDSCIGFAQAVDRFPAMAKYYIEQKKEVNGSPTQRAST